VQASAGEIRLAGGEAYDLERHLSREILQSERLRMAILARFFAALVVLVGLLAWMLPRGPRPLAAVMVACGLVAYELLVRRMLGRMLVRGTMSPKPLRYLNAAIEVSVPTLIMILVGHDVEPIAVLQGPAAYLYGVFIVLSVLRLDLALSAFTGAFAAAEFTALSFAHLSHDDIAATMVLSAPAFILGKAVVLLLSGVVAGLVAIQLRGKIRRTLRALQERERVMNAFGQQVSPEVVDELLKQWPAMASRRSFVCVMFMDIRNFTPLVEHRSPEDIVALQNEVFSAAIDVVNRHHGVIHQFLGDGFMATFGAPLSRGNDCANALAAARALIARITQVRIGIGLHAGEVVTGNVGSPERKQYSVTGNVVILASRIEQLNKEYGSQLLVSGEVLARAGGQRAATPLGPVRVKGHEQPIEIFRVA
jgi:adenylate cyclase